MKSNYIASKSAVKMAAREVAKEEIRIQMETECPKCMKNCVYQALATMMWVLHRDYGWGAIRLNRLKDDTEAEFELMESGLHMIGKIDYSGNDCIQALKGMGVDFERSQYSSKEKK